MGAFDGNGNFVRSYLWTQDKANGMVRGATVTSNIVCNILES